MLAFAKRCDKAMDEDDDFFGSIDENVQYAGVRLLKVVFGRWNIV